MDYDHANPFLRTLSYVPTVTATRLLEGRLGL